MVPEPIMLDYRKSILFSIVYVIACRIRLLDVCFSYYFVIFLSAFFLKLHIRVMGFPAKIRPSLSPESCIGKGKWEPSYGWTCYWSEIGPKSLRCFDFSKCKTRSGNFQIWTRCYCSDHFSFRSQSQSWNRWLGLVLFRKTKRLRGGSFIWWRDGGDIRQGSRRRPWWRVAWWRNFPKSISATSVVGFWCVTYLLESS